ncbi:hypothetical protein [Arthrobacter sp. VKM Ac-2550]|uniref:hypothetical protein n=1 Tax=Crystallibacter permensis TaxID=1938888 RepID=UPI002226CE8F|nr:hypothetical protein [Arthrobacter sp. VKM Ac-2550]MCW2135470.1 hypothetical protein [Arthrobacter sp. VKM Ac-2550]
MMGTAGVWTNAIDSIRTVRDLLNVLESFETVTARKGELSYYTRHQDNNQFSALVADEDADRMKSIGADEFNRIHTMPGSLTARRPGLPSGCRGKGSCRCSSIMTQTARGSRGYVMLDEKLWQGPLIQHDANRRSAPLCPGQRPWARLSCEAPSVGVPGRAPGSFSTNLRHIG